MATPRPLRQDAARNRERLVRAARDVFRRKGLDAPLDEIAREAGVAIGTLYNRFPTRGELVDAALSPLAQQAVEIAERAAVADDPWDGFASFMEESCELLAGNRGYTDVHRSRLPGTPVIDAAQHRLAVLKKTIVTRAKAAGVLRADLEPSDLALLTWGIAGTARATREVAPDAWRRHLALLLDGLRPEAAHPLPVPPLTGKQLRGATPG
ncbi:TetR/AcrR family transcriptional regulator [Streptomyces sp. HPF1205]|uniref:TetR/AcrR family transcriptional regulator n=1 Tax=Streptomyces sp. HPF1205 TaxID=2873262 RepID=UPI001CEDF7D7|nr:TetR/AcrR family transcriptional regulator [Streptomyces sp. HPF1205]